MSKTALVCGVSGQDGAYLSRLLLSKGYKVIGTSRCGDDSESGNLKRLGISGEVEIKNLSLLDGESVGALLSSLKPDEIYNLSGQSSVGLSFNKPVETFESHANSTLNLLDLIRKAGFATRFFNAGSGECFGETSGKGADESTPFAPRSPYAVAKCASFWATANFRDSYGVYACTGILFNHESPLRSANFVTRKIVNAACQIASGSKEKLLLGNLQVKRDWGWAEEYVEAMWRMLQQDSPEDFVIATGEMHSLAEFVATVFSTLGLDWHDHVEIDQSLMRPSEIIENRGNPSKAESQLGWMASLQMKDVVAGIIS